MPQVLLQWNDLMETTKYILIGGGGHSRVVSSIVEAQDNGTVSGFFDSNEKLKSLDGIENLGQYNSEIASDSLAVIAIGDNKLREKIAVGITHDFGILIHPSATVDRLSSVDLGTVVMHHSVIQTGSKVGKHVIINTSSSIDHDCTIADFVHIAPKVTLCGGVEVGKGTLIGVGSVVLPQIKIGANVTIGAGSVVVSDIPDGSTVVGAPGKIIKSNG